ncbi:MAG TPA: AEC family transporter [Anaerovoracaceae bacterium]|nr:AEC family transporter [Anaerovoracaceae bacterium]
MDIILLGLNVVIPLFVVMLVGYIAKRIGLINDNGVGAINRLLFWIFLPSILFVSVYETDLGRAFDFALILYSVIFTALIFLFGMIFVPRFEKIRNRCGVIIQALIRGNEVYFGFPVVVSLIGREYLGAMSIVVAFAVISFNTYSIIALEYFKGETVNVKSLILNVLRNPMILATLVAAIFNLAGIRIPFMIMAGIDSISQVATPLALFLLGASFNFVSTKKYVKEVIWVTFLRLIITPGVVVLTTVWMGFSPTDTVILFVTFGVPTAVSGYSLARELNADYELASQFVVFTSAFAILSIFLWTVYFQFAGII